MMTHLIIIKKPSLAFALTIENIREVNITQRKSLPQEHFLLQRYSDQSKFTEGKI